MLQRNASCIFSSRTRARLRTLFLYLCLAVSLAGYEASFATPAGVAAGPSFDTRHPATHNRFALSQDSAAQRVVLRAPASRLPSGTRLRPESRDDELPPIHLLPCWALAVDVPRLPVPRIEPVAWEREAPSFLLPSASGLVPLAIPPPFRLA